VFRFVKGGTSSHRRLYRIAIDGLDCRTPAYAAALAHLCELSPSLQVQISARFGAPNVFSGSRVRRCLCDAMPVVEFCICVRLHVSEFVLRFKAIAVDRRDVGRLVFTMWCDGG
jgi:hypothetical protein